MYEDGYLMAQEVVGGLGGFLGPQMVRVSGTAETEYCFGQAFSDLRYQVISQ